MTTDFYLPLSAAQERWHNAERIKSLKRVILPTLEDWNYKGCKHHPDGPTPQCSYRLCGGDFFDHQTKSIAWLYVAQNGLEASVTGSGKTNVALGLLCLAKHYGETLRAVIVCQTPAVDQWASEASRFAPGLDTAHVKSGTPKNERLALYASNWEVLIIGHHLMTRDVEELTAVGPLQVISDDVDPILNMGNRTHKAMALLAGNAERVVEFNATSLQTRLQQLYAAASLFGGREVWGTIKAFETRYVKREPVYIRINNELKKTFKATGYKNLVDFRSKMDPMSIRHSYEDLNDIRMPESMPPQQIWLDLHPAQRAKYEQLQSGVLDLLKKDQPPEQRMVSALAAYTHGQQICTGLPALGEADGPGASSKLDWLENRLITDWVDNKIVVFTRNVGTVSAFHDRLKTHGIGYATVWGENNKNGLRQEEIKRFWDDPNCRVMIGTAAMERSLNLQVSNILVFLDTIPNPARMTQVMGRVKRAGSMHSHVWTFYLLTRDTQEERSLKALAARQAVVDAVNDEDDAGLFDKLTAEELLRLISP